MLLYPSQRSPEVWQKILEIVTTNLIFNEERGREASGIAVIQKNGDSEVLKQPVSASELIKMDDYQHLLSTVNSNTTCILGHTRMPTKGSRWHNVNNHPVFTDYVIGVHNGVIANDDALFTQMNLPRAGEVDSEIIFRLMETVNPVQHNGNYLGLITQKVNLLQGIFATLSVDLRKPTRLLALKNLRPLCIHYEEQWQGLFFSSRYLFLRKAFGRGVITEALESGHGFYFDAESLPQNGSRPSSSFEIAPQSESTEAEVQ